MNGTTPTTAVCAKVRKPPEKLRPENQNVHPDGSTSVPTACTTQSTVVRVEAGGVGLSRNVNAMALSSSPGVIEASISHSSTGFLKCVSSIPISAIGDSGPRLILGFTPVIGLGGRPLNLFQLSLAGKMGDLMGAGVLTLTEVTMGVCCLKMDVDKSILKFVN